MLRRKKTKEEGAHLLQRGSNVSHEKQIKMPFPIACVNWPRGCKYKTPRGIPTEEQVLQVLELHKRLCKKMDFEGTCKSPSPAEKSFDDIASLNAKEYKS